MNLSEAKTYLKEHQAKLHAYAHAMNVLYYDGVTVAPRGGSALRGDTMAFLAGESYKVATSAEAADVLDHLAEHSTELSPAEARQTEILRKDLLELRKIPMAEYVEWQQLINDAEAAWHQAKEDSDWKRFEPYMEKIVAGRLRFASLIAPEKAPYDYCLDQFEEGLTQESCDRFFQTVIGRITPLLERVKAAPAIDASFLFDSVPEYKQEKLSDFVMKTMGLDPLYSALGTTEHPFTTNFSRYDVRITTHYHENDFTSSLFSVIHEGGHALYELHTDEAYQKTVLAEGCSMALHESQSRFYENILARSRAFTDFLYPVCARLSPAVASHTSGEFYRAINRAEPSLIRTEADELTYSLHVAVRYELEKKLMNGSLAVRDLPEAWNALYKKYLGVDVPDDRRGVLQDSHWSGGSIGYFPSYALGSAYGAQFIRRMRRDLDVDALLAKGDFAPINAWGEEHIWRFGRLYKPGELLEKVLGESFDPTAYTDYLEQKFTEIYGL